ncbi:SPW repeat protein [Natronolimnohabitans sp. A-GB9]|uniref:SPW repeat domain-containing protein n=1 Tax=Natronolimnohabitans sp. A-GB9 TaxID=3069757 RepID=UPI0027B57A07|nr:SPW repeat protein [Natronolimnohabitans sp. A-GB9]MDQ2052485.1 SPW repeat protein [Natronolimnohabitans sp. A-GB9]
MSDTRTTTNGSPIPVRTAGLAAVIGAWVLWSGVILTGTGAIVLNNVVVGAAIAAIAAYAAAWPDGGRLPAIAAPLVAALLGLWIVAAPFVFEVGERLLWSNVISGILVVILAGSSVYGSWQLTQSRATGV